jgi:hypothetical protein
MEHRWLLLYLLSLSTVYFSVMRSINILFAATVEAATQAHWVAHAVSLIHPTIWLQGLQIKASHGVLLKKIHGHLYISCFMCFWYNSNSQECNLHV